MMKLCRTAYPVFSLLVVTAAFFAVPSSAWADSDDEQVVKDFVEQFLATLGDGDLDALSRTRCGVHSAH